MVYLHGIRRMMFSLSFVNSSKSSVSIEFFEGMERMKDKMVDARTIQIKIIKRTLRLLVINSVIFLNIVYFLFLTLLR